jgi:hypothetical protein
LNKNQKRIGDQFKNIELSMERPLTPKGEPNADHVAKFKDQISSEKFCLSGK